MNSGVNFERPDVKILEEVFPGNAKGGEIPFLDLLLRREHKTMDMEIYRKSVDFQMPEELFPVLRTTHKAPL